MNNDFCISKGTIVKTDYTNNVLKNAASILQRDILKTATLKNESNQISLKLNSSENSKDESFSIKIVNKEKMEVTANSELGIMYGILAISREVLGIDDFWFWLDIAPTKHPYFKVHNCDSIKQPKYHVKYRGWFVNDELLLNHWQYHDSKQYVWQLIFETLLRCGGNVVIPGTDTNSHLNRNLAADMGLIIAHHHAEPLGAEMFSRVYPDLEASYFKYPELFQQIWQESINRQKNNKVLWNIGFRGQGDRPFWDDDSHNYSLEDKADVINSVIKKQYDMIKQSNPKAICSINIYGELTALYNANLLNIPEDVIQIWADNGYGKVISRRQGNDDPRSEVLHAGNSNLSQGIYYHIAFHDLQASNFLTLLQIDPNYVSKELNKVRKAGMDYLVICNTGNIKPHIFYLWLIAQSWQEDFQINNNAKIISQYVKSYYSSNYKSIIEIYERYFKTTFNYRNFEDQKAGDEFYTYTLRKIIYSWLSNKNQLSEMEWLTGNLDINKQIKLINNLIKDNVDPFSKLLDDSKILIKQLSIADVIRFYNDIMMSISVHTYAIQALQYIILSYYSTQEENYVKSFLLANKAQKSLENIIYLRQNNPSSKWKHFYDNDCYTNIELTIDIINTLKGYIRIIGDGPDKDQWERKFIMRKSDSRVMLLSNTHKSYSDQDMADFLQADNNV